MRIWTLGLLLLLACHEETTGSTNGSDVREVLQPYNEAANAEADIRAALERAGEDKRVILMLGANWCSWCRRLEYVFRNEPRISARLRESFELVHVNTGARGSGANAALNEHYGNPLQYGLPVLVVLDADGEVLRTQPTGVLEEGDYHDPEKVLAFLNEVAP